MNKILLCLLFLFTISISNILSTSIATHDTIKTAGFTGFKCRYAYKNDYFRLNYTDCWYRCDNYVNGASTRMPNGAYAHYVNKKIFAGGTCPLVRDD